MSKSLEELKNEMASLYANKQGVAIAKKVKVFTVDLHLGTPQQYDYEYSKNIIAEYAFIAGFDAAIKAVSDREKKLVESCEKALFALQCMIIKFNGEVPGLTGQQVFEGAIQAMENLKETLKQISEILEVKP